MAIDDQQMCCLVCYYVAPLHEAFQSEKMDDGEEFGICPKCGEFNIGGYESFSEWHTLPEDHRRLILDAITERKE